MGEWERSMFAMSGTELAVHEALVAMQRVLIHPEISDAARKALEQAVSILRAEQD